jgi:uncharacterized membrane protein YphA (DoxX/SURF4 family)
MRAIRVRYPDMILAAIFLGAGFSALFGQEEVRSAFHAWGYPDWFRVTMGVVQDTAGGSLLIPRAVPAASTMLGVVMIGAIVTHIRAGEMLFDLIPAAVFAALIYVGISGWRELKRK